MLCPLNMALPKLAEIPQKRAAAAMKKYPRQGCGGRLVGALLFREHLFEPLRIETDHHLFIHDDGGRRAALIFFYKVTQRREIVAHVAFLKWYPSLREVGLGPGAGRSARLAEHDDRLLLHSTIRVANCDERCRYLSGIIVISSAISPGGTLMSLDHDEFSRRQFVAKAGIAA